VKTLFDEQVYRIGNWLYLAVKIDGDSVAFNCRRVDCELWGRGFCTLSEWKRDVSDVGDLYEGAV
jgi:hypothetical protein